MKVLRVAFIVSIMFVAFALPVNADSELRFDLVQKSDKQVQVFVRNANDLSAFEIELCFDDLTGGKGTKYRIRNVSPSKFLEKNPRSFSQVGPQVRSDGKITFGFFSFGESPGLNGKGALATIKCKGGGSKLKITNVKATDSMGNVLACRF